MSTRPNTALPILRTVILTPQQVTRLRHLNRAEGAAKTALRVAAMRLESAIMEAQQASVDYLHALAEEYQFDPGREWVLDNGALVTRMTPEEAEGAAAMPSAADAADVAGLQARITEQPNAQTTLHLQLAGGIDKGQD